MAYSQPIAPRSGRTRSRCCGQATNDQRHSLGSAHRRALARYARTIWQRELGLRALFAREQARGWDAAFEMLASLGPPADEEHAIDSTIVRAHQHAAGVKGGIKNKKPSAARPGGSRPKSTSARTPRASR